MGYHYEKSDSRKRNRKDYLPHLQRNELHSVSQHVLGSIQLSHVTLIVSASQ